MGAVIFRKTKVAGSVNREKGCVFFSGYRQAGEKDRQQQFEYETLRYFHKVPFSSAILGEFFLEIATERERRPGPKDAVSG